MLIVSGVSCALVMISSGGGGVGLEDSSLLSRRVL